jgi:hypothetical protein
MEVRGASDPEHRQARKRPPRSLAGKLAEQGTCLARCADMPTVTPPSSQRTPSDDAPHTERAAHDEVGQPKPAPGAALRPEPVDPDDDPYDNMACTD